MDLVRAARCMESLGNETRLAIFQLLVRSGPEGLPVGKLQESLSMPGSTLSHHVSHLVNAGLIQQQREGRVLRCVPEFTQMTAMIEFLTAECCAAPSQCC